jgi:hypothetical protein
MTYLTPSEQEAVLAAAFEAVLDEGGAELARVHAMNRRVRERLVEVITDMRHAVDDGDRDVMRSALIDARVALGDLLDARDDQATKVIIE